MTSTDQPKLTTLPAADKKRRSLSSVLSTEAILEAVGTWAAEHTGAVDVIDLGGGAGGMGVPLAQQGYRVMVVDPSPNALASLHRRGIETKLGDSLRGVQGDASDLVELAGPHSADLVTCHEVLDVIDDKPAAIRAMAQVLRPGGAVSLLVRQRYQRVMHKAVAGDVAGARQALRDDFRLDSTRMRTLLEDAGFRIVEIRGLGAVLSAVSEDVLDAAATREELMALEADISRTPDMWSLAPQLHVFAVLD